jgi:hypothetical protein
MPMRARSFVCGRTLATRGGILSDIDDLGESVIANIAMIRRTFTDRDGVAWTVAESPPRVLTLIRPRERRHEPRTHDRVVGAARFATRDLGVPCLQFESARQRRQLTPIPSGWEEIREDELEDLLGASTLLPTE